MTEKFKKENLKVIFGLGNPEEKYFKTRHNAGFLFLDFLTNKADFKENRQLRAFIFKDSKGILYVKPNTYMNNSGECVNLVMKYFKINIDEILVAFDDLDIAIGDTKLQFAKGPKVHNGLNSIENILGTNQFWRARIGVENRSAEDRKYIAGMDYVLSNFGGDEPEILEKSFVEFKEKYL